MILHDFSGQEDSSSVSQWMQLMVFFRPAGVEDKLFTPVEILWAEKQR